MGYISEAFLFNSNSALIEDRLGIQILSVFENNAWKADRLFQFNKDFDNFCFHCLKIAWNDKITYLLYEKSNWIYYHKLEGNQISNSDNLWKPLMIASTGWVPAMLGNELVIFYHNVMYME